MFFIYDNNKTCELNSGLKSLGINRDDEHFKHIEYLKISRYIRK